MPEFVDSAGQAWSVSLDGLLLAELREKASLDLVQDGLYAVEEREDVLTKALLVICREQRELAKLTEKQFAQRLIGEVQDKAIGAVRGAAQLFFRPSKWSAIQSRCAKRKEMDATYETIRPMLEMLNRPDMPPAMRDAVMEVISGQIEAATSGQQLTDNPSASGQDASQPNAAGDSQDSLASIQAA